MGFNNYLTFALSKLYTEREDIHFMHIIAREKSQLDVLLQDKHHSEGQLFYQPKKKLNLL